MLYSQVNIKIKIHIKQTENKLVLDYDRPYLVEEALDDRDEGGGHSVEREENIVGLNRVHTLRVKIKVFVLEIKFTMLYILCT